MKLAEMEKFVGNEPTISYVGIRGDEEREGYVSTKPNIQAIFLLGKYMEFGCYQSIFESKECR